MTRAEEKAAAERADLFRLTRECLAESKFNAAFSEMDGCAIVYLPLDITLAQMMGFLGRLNNSGLTYHTYDEFDGKMVSKAFKLDSLRIVIEWPDTFGLD